MHGPDDIAGLRDGGLEFSARPLVERKVVLSLATEADHASNNKSRTAPSDCFSISRLIKASPANWRGVNMS
jgi:hypothetical protein